MKRFSILLFLLLGSGFVFGAVSDYKYDWNNPTLELRYEKLTKELRCPKCQNQNVADSDAPISQDIRDKVYELLNDGKTDKEIVDFMVARYSEFVTYRTRLSWTTIWLYLGPALLLALGLAVLIVRTRKPTKQLELTEEQLRKADELLNRKE
ncbi:cytochrome c-type biogenesis protein [Gynuella sp.]|uniref:cytochrome c-type biogenesis protein n=1 Tax=Gynuella sp. TaxID=2969146 RepID=UPI003D0F8971